MQREQALTIKYYLSIAYVYTFKSRALYTVKDCVFTQCLTLHTVVSMYDIANVYIQFIANVLMPYKSLLMCFEKHCFKKKEMTKINLLLYHRSHIFTAVKF